MCNEKSTPLDCFCVKAVVRGKPEPQTKRQTASLSNSSLATTTVEKEESNKMGSEKRRNTSVLSELTNLVASWGKGRKRFDLIYGSERKI